MKSASGIFSFKRTFRYVAVFRAKICVVWHQYLPHWLRGDYLGFLLLPLMSLLFFCSDRAAARQFIWQADVDTTNKQPV